MNGSAMKAALTSTTLILCAALNCTFSCTPGQCQDPFNDNQTWASQPPGAFLNTKPAAKKPVVTQAAKKTAAKPPPLKPNIQSQPTLSRTGGNQSSGQFQPQQSTTESTVQSTKSADGSI
jgi:hypothetical protein